MRCLLVRLVTVAAIVLMLASCGSDATDDVATSPGSEDASVESAPEEATAAAQPTVEPTVATLAATTEPIQAADVPVGDGLFPTVVAADARLNDGETWRFDVTLLSEYDSPERYADAWRVLDADDNELGIRVLGHDHANEQPFTRSHTVDVPADLTTVFIEGRDQVNGWSGERFELVLAR